MTHGEMIQKWLRGVMETNVERKKRERIAEKEVNVKIVGISVPKVRNRAI